MKKTVLFVLAASGLARAQDTTPPEITCPEDVTIEADENCSASYEGPAAEATDDQDADPTLGPELPVLLDGPGEHVITHTATDDAGNEASCEQIVTVIDVTPPSLTAVTATPACLWPPNHKLVAYRLGDNLTIEATDACPGDPGIAVEIESNEPEDGQGDGHTAPDSLVGSEGFCLRAERSGGGDGRQYLIRVQAADTAGNTSEETIEIGVGVAHDQSAHDCPKVEDSVYAVDDDPACTIVEGDGGAEAMNAGGAGCSAYPARFTGVPTGPWVLMAIFVVLRALRQGGAKDLRRADGGRAQVLTLLSARSASL